MERPLMAAIQPFTRTKRSSASNWNSPVGVVAYSASISRTCRAIISSACLRAVISSMTAPKPKTSPAPSRTGYQAFTPEARHAGRGGRLTGELVIQHGFARRQDAARHVAESFDECGHDLGDMPAQVRLGGNAVDLRETFIDADVAQIPIKEAKADGRGVEKSIE